MNMFKCSDCIENHPVEPTELACLLPDEVARLSMRERTKRCLFIVPDDLVVLDENRFFLRGLISLPVQGRSFTYSLGVWAEISWHAFMKIGALWENPNQANEKPLPGTLANCLPGLPPCIGLPLCIYLTGPSTRPQFRLMSGEHQLINEQFNGISLHRVFEYTCGER